MANVQVKIMVGKKSNNDFECEKEYNFSIGKKDSKMPAETILNIIEDAMFERLKDSLGVKYNEKN